jgi:hypothetical protein
MMGEVMDPADLTFEALAAELRARGGPAWRAAVDAGIDVTLTERNLALTPDERLIQLDAMLALIHGAAREPQAAPEQRCAGAGAHRRESGVHRH